MLKQLCPFLKMLALLGFECSLRWVCVWGVHGVNKNAEGGRRGGEGSEAPGCREPPWGVRERILLTPILPITWTPARA